MIRVHICTSLHRLRYNSWTASRENLSLGLTIKLDLNGPSEILSTCVSIVHAASFDSISHAVASGSDITPCKKSINHYSYIDVYS